MRIWILQLCHNSGYSNTYVSSRISFEIWNVHKICIELRDTSVLWGPFSIKCCAIFRIKSVTYFKFWNMNNSIWKNFGNSKRMFLLCIVYGSPCLDFQISADKFMTFSKLYCWRKRGCWIIYDKMWFLQPQATLCKICWIAV